MRLKDRVAIVTGASRGIGNAVVRGFAREGAHVVLNYIEHESEVMQTVQTLEADGVQILPYRADITSDEQILAMVDAAMARFGRIDILVNNAGIYPRKHWYEITEEEWDQVLGINLKGCFLCCKAVYPHMKQKGYGRIINVSSVTFWNGIENLAHYTASKGGIIGLTRGLARELGRDGIGINAITPGAIQTETELEMFADQQEVFVKQFAELQALPQRLVSDDVVGTVVFLASEDSAMITGQTINVDGGWMLH